MASKEEQEEQKARKEQEEYTARIEQLRTRLQDIDHPMVRDEHVLNRFLRARQNNVAKAETMLRDSMKWRQENDVDNAMSTARSFGDVRVLKEHYPHFYHKRDKLGRPLYIERIGRLDIGGVQRNFLHVGENSGDNGRLMAYHIFFNEYLNQRVMPACSEAKGEHVETICTILDLDGAGRQHMSKAVYDFVQTIASVDQNNYPEILGKLFIINAPMLFSVAWAVIKPWLDKNTVDKITILRSNYKNELLSVIDAENLPRFLGGTCDCDGDCCSNAPEEKEFIQYVLKCAAEHQQEEKKAGPDDASEPQQKQQQEAQGKGPQQAEPQQAATEQQQQQLETDVQAPSSLARKSDPSSDTQNLQETAPRL